MNPDGTHGAEHVTDEGIELVDVVRLDTALAGIEELGDHLRAASAEIRRLEAELEAAREREKAAHVELARHLCFTNHAAQRDFWTRVEDRAAPREEG